MAWTLSSNGLPFLSLGYASITVGEMLFPEGERAVPNEPRHGTFGDVLFPKGDRLFPNCFCPCPEYFNPSIFETN